MRRATVGACRQPGSSNTRPTIGTRTFAAQRFDIGKRAEPARGCRHCRKIALRRPPHPPLLSHRQLLCCARVTASINASADGTGE